MKSLSKETFIQTINFIRDRADAQYEINKLFSSEFEDSIFWPYNRYETQLVKILSEMFESDVDWISYFIYELNFGRDWKPSMITQKLEDGSVVDIPLATAEDLYNLLTTM